MGAFLFVQRLPSQLPFSEAGCALKGGENIKKRTCGGMGKGDTRTEARLDPDRELRHSEAAPLRLVRPAAVHGQIQPFPESFGVTSDVRHVRAALPRTIALVLGWPPGAFSW